MFASFTEVNQSLMSPMYQNSTMRTGKQRRGESVLSHFMLVAIAEVLTKCAEICLHRHTAKLLWIRSLALLCLHTPLVSPVLPPGGDPGSGVPAGGLQARPDPDGAG